MSVMEKRRFLLHVCCAPCSVHPLRELKNEFDVTLYFYNPNIHPEVEYARRLGEAERVASIEGLPMLVGEYRHEEWTKTARLWRDEPERGKRCEFCIGDRLTETARKADELGFGVFGTVLTLSRLKSSIMINGLGETSAKNFAGIEFHVADWKKRDGSNIAAKISDELGLTRQNYCGCEYSVRPPKAASVATRG
ncbi:MAG: epoxyqueuosine reductase QueH [Nitrospinae bacterium]|nr:epoxyqueuosine reductase QueH [Nitrospinota bacterium]